MYIFLNLEMLYNYKNVTISKGYKLTSTVPFLYPDIPSTVPFLYPVISIVDNHIPSSK